MSSKDYYEDEEQFSNQLELSSFSDDEKEFCIKKFLELANKVYRYAKNGMSLIMISTLNKIENDNIVNVILNKIFEDDDGQYFSPLAAAVIYGRTGVVKFLLSNYKIDLEKECVMKFDGHLVKGVTALWCAAGSDHLKIVKLLIKKGANVNHTTKSRSSPLRAACYEGSLDIVRYLVSHGADVNIANSFNNTSLMIAAYKGHIDIVEYLLSVQADPNGQALCGATALHFAAECGYEQICSTLLNFGATLQKNGFGLTPVLLAAERTHVNTVELFVNWPGLLTKQEKIDAYELMGASFANDKDNYNVNKSYIYLRTAMDLRFEDSENVIRKDFTTPIPAYDNWIESQNIQELQAIRQNHNSIHMESLAIKERILGKNYPHLPQPIVFRGAIFADHKRFDRCESLWLYALQLRQTNGTSIERDLLRFAQLYSQMLHIGETFKLSNFLEVLSAAIEELQVNKKNIANPGPKDDPVLIAYEFEQNILTSIYLITIITKILKNNTQKFQTKDISILYKLIYTLIKFNPRLRDGQSVLHLSVNGITPIDDFHTNDVCRFPDYDTVKLLLYCGASNNLSDVDLERNTPLHTLTSTAQSVGNIESISVIDNIIRLFIKYNVHLDAVNKDGLTASKVSALHVISQLVQQYERQSITLKCLSSRSVALHKINYKGNIPKSLEDYIQMHSAEKY